MAARREIGHNRRRPARSAANIPEYFSL